jgi:hypothetical protein
MIIDDEILFTPVGEEDIVGKTKIALPPIYS